MEVILMDMMNAASLTNMENVKGVTVQGMYHALLRDASGCKLLTSFVECYIGDFENYSGDLFSNHLLIRTEFGEFPRYAIDINDGKADEILNTLLTDGVYDFSDYVYRDKIYYVGRKRHRDEEFDRECVEKYGVYEEGE